MMWDIEAKQAEAHLLRTSISLNDRFRMLVLSDVHFDSPECDRDLLVKHLDQAQAINAPVLIIGDWFDSMRSTGDRRHTHGAREEYDRLEYLDVLVENSAKFLTKYKDVIALITQGNHESAMLRHHNTDLTRRLAREIGSCYGMYRGWLVVNTRLASKGQTTLSTKIYYDHGSGGSAPVTRGVIKTNRRAVMLPDADIVLSGHIHERWIVEVPRIRLHKNYSVTQQSQIHVSTGTYKKEDLTKGWGAEKGFGPPALGGCWLDLWAERVRSTQRYEIKVSASYT